MRENILTNENKISLLYINFHKYTWIVVIIRQFSFIYLRCSCYFIQYINNKYILLLLCFKQIIIVVLQITTIHTNYIKYILIFILYTFDKALPTPGTWSHISGELRNIKKNLIFSHI